MIDRKSLLTDLKKQVGALEKDLREHEVDDKETHARLYSEWQKARTASRIAATYESWLDDRVTQSAVAWILGTVFLRFCEDNGLIEMPFLAGPDDRLNLAQERQADYIRQNPHDTDRDWILAGFKEMSRSPVAAGLFDKAHNPMWQIEIPHHAAKALLAFWRRRDENGETVHDFTDPDWDTRFLGDLYQDLSEHAKKTYALLQTPEFVEEFILDYTLTPAIDEFGLDGLRLIDPTCGSGHFLLGAFHRILNKWRDAEPAIASTNIWELIRRTLLSVHGVDKNPFATNIARFRLLAATMKAGEVSTLASAPDFPIIVATGDSLLHGRGAPGIQQDLLSEAEPHTYATEDIYEFISSENDVRKNVVDLLGAGSYHVVVGNPPYITVKDKQENENYRVAYGSCSGKYALSVPFVERFFQLTCRGRGGNSSSGFVGQLTANSFMKREFGRKLVEEYLPTVELTYLVDTSGAYIPGHGTPTVILIGRRQWGRSAAVVRAVLGIRGEPSQPEDPSNSFVWRAIVEQVAIPGSESEWVSVEDLPREKLARHPWSLSGGGASQLMANLESRPHKLKNMKADIGMSVLTLEDDVYVLSASAALRKNFLEECTQIVVGDNVRDYRIGGLDCSIMPYRESGERRHVSKKVMRHFWPWRTKLKNRIYFGNTPEQRGLRWFDLGMYFPARHKSALSIVFAFVATHNHFALDFGGKVFNRTAPVIKLPSGSTEDEHAEVIGVLNSSTACFWLKQVAHDRGNGGYGGGIASEEWERFYEFTATKLFEFPLPEQLPLQRGRELAKLARSLESASLWRRFDEPPSREILEDLAKRWHSIRGRMIAEQEELDWQVYSLYGLLEEELTAPPDRVPEIRFGERAFEIAIARGFRDGRATTQWFNRHEAMSVAELPDEWPEEYKRVVERRIEIIENRRDIALIERPEFKRRWAAEPWERQKKSALRNWLLDRSERRSLWLVDDDQGVEQPRVMTAHQLADQLRRDEDFVSVARLYEGEDVELAEVVTGLIQDEHVPHLAVLRYKDPAGLRKRAQWDNVWKQQREEDRTGKKLDISLPPKYTQADFLKASYWRNRGKLDVPKERFISYPGSGPDGDSSILLGWAGWDHREQAQALMMLIEERATQDGWDAARLTPLLAGLAEVLPWVRQWHGEVDPAFGQSPADAYTVYLEDKQREYGISDEDLKNWRPEKPKRGGGRKASS
ncbi:BREX-2 system adenine-specific DNA-methyltransferase PglX [Actinomadura decatromicini]|uniref:site-specific DNA-methyltransferase (adenine-specific) n=1 Tax=Actinomadura decatromicini TaxID=2604572 RepID=A0A5D3F5Y7_9ACTN|nr:BREX-2 system adenine-specific DNA-methyltransferase PglX [Actinomadura decatromicini]TYK43414.1 BREX-2 system adenine-specific DNA-methyltransferase PglX [Actinomadura decatromicini]